MLDLKSKLLQAGLVTKDQVQRVDEQRRAEKARRYAAKPKFSKPKPKSEYFDFRGFESYQRDKKVEEFKKLSRPLQYEVVRRWVKRNRLDSESIKDTNTERFFFQKEDGSVSWLSLPPPIYGQVTDGAAAIMAYMSHHGLVHCVIPRDIAEDVALVYPLWLRVLKDHPLAGKLIANETT